MEERTQEVLLQYFERTCSPSLAPEQLVEAAADAFARLLSARAVCFLTKAGGYLPPGLLVYGEGGQNRAQESCSKGPPPAPPGRDIIEESKTCMARGAGRSVCVCKADADKTAWWLFLLEEGGAVCGAALCAVAKRPREKALAAARRLAQDAAPRFAQQYKAQEKRGALPHGDAVTLLSHECKTPLTVALSSLQLLRRKLQDEAVSADVEKYTNYAELHLYKALRLVINLVDTQYARPDECPFRPSYVDLAQLLRELTDGAQPYAEAVGAHLTFENRAQGSCRALCDAQLTERIVLNLLSNALKHAPRKSAVRVALERGAAEWRIHVDDEGAGIAPKSMEHLFQKFWRGPDERAGTGLGLYLSRCFAQRMGGALRAENRPQGGARFTLCFPLEAGAAAGGALCGVPSEYRRDPRDTMLRIEFSELLSQKCI